MLRTLVAALALVTIVTLPAPQAHAGDISLLAGIGPRFDVGEGKVNAVGVIHFSYALVDVTVVALLLSAEFQSYTGGVGLPDDIAFADLQTGLLLAVPIGWFGIEVGANIGMQNLIEKRHKSELLVAMVKPELAITATAAMFKARISYQHNALPLGEEKGTETDDGQFLFMAGVVF